MTLSAEMIRWFDDCERQAFGRPRHDRVDAEKAQQALDVAERRLKERQAKKALKEQKPKTRKRKMKLNRWKPAHSELPTWNVPTKGNI
jgi:hypothetical protein